VSLTIEQARADGFDDLDAAIRAQETTKPFWTKRIRETIHEILIRKGTFSANDLASIEIPAIHSGLIPGQVRGVATKGLMRKIGHTTSTIPTRHGAEIRTYEITDLGRERLAGVGAGMDSPPGASSDPGEEASDIAADSKTGSEVGSEPSSEEAPNSLASSEPVPLFDLGQPGRFTDPDQRND